MEKNGHNSFNCFFKKNNINNIESQFLWLWVHGKSMRDISSELNISIKNINSVKRCLLEKIGTESRKDTIQFLIFKFGRNQFYRYKH